MCKHNKNIERDTIISKDIMDIVNAKRYQILRRLKCTLHHFNLGSFLNWPFDHEILQFIQSIGYYEVVNITLLLESITFSPLNPTKMMSYFCKEKKYMKIILDVQGYQILKRLMLEYWLNN